MKRGDPPKRRTPLARGDKPLRPDPSRYRDGYSHNSTLRGTSPARRQVLAKYDKLRSEFLEANPICRRCQRARASDVHHMRGRVGDLMLDTRWWLPLCRACHAWVDVHPEAAIEGGFAALRNTVNPELPST